MRADFILDKDPHVHFACKLRKIYREANQKGPIYTGGDFNARIQEQLGQGENKIIGKHLFDSDNTNLELDLDESKAENRKQMINHCKKKFFNGLVIRKRPGVE